MKLTVEQDDGKTIVYQNVTDIYLAVRQLDTVQSAKDGSPALLPVTASHSWGGNVRELVKEVQQSLVELQDYLKEQRHGNHCS